MRSVGKILLFFLLGIASCQDNYQDESVNVFVPARPSSTANKGKKVEKAHKIGPRRRTEFVVAPSLRIAALRVLSGPQLDACDRAFLGRLDLEAFVREGSKALVWFEGAEVVAAEFELKDGRRIRAGNFDDQRMPAGWYDQDGLSLASEVLGRPILLSQVTSRFGERLHPITGQKKWHHGIDYGAPEGTPVFAVGDGTVTVAASGARAGNHLVVRHNSGFESRYLHLHHFADGISHGSKIKQGQVIAFVGSTGASTGPHLHYELHRGGIVLDPQKKLALPLRALGPLSQPQHRKNLEALP